MSAAAVAAADTSDPTAPSLDSKRPICGTHRGDEGGLQITASTGRARTGATDRNTRGPSPHALVLAGAILGAATSVFAGLAVPLTAALAGAAAIATAIALRATHAAQTAQHERLDLERALRDSERTCQELTHANLELRTTQIAFADLLNLADERTNGRMRELIEDTGTELASLLDEELERARRR